MVPRNRVRVPSKPSFIFSASAVLSRISSPIAIVNCRRKVSVPCLPVVSSLSHIFQHLDLLTHLARLIVILTLELI